MGKLVFGMMQSLDGYVAGARVGLDRTATSPASRGFGLELPPPGVLLGRHFNDRGVRGLAGSLCGRRMYEVMRYWDEDQPDWDVGDHDFRGKLWRALAEMGRVTLAQVRWRRNADARGVATLKRSLAAG